MREPKRLNIANKPTPIERTEFDGTQFFIKRDDLTGSLLSGNKIRKLEYILPDVQKKKADYLFTCGGDQSNHARATAIAAKKINVNTKLFLWGSDSKNADGNLFLDKLTGTKIKYLSKKEYESVIPIMLNESKKLQKKGKKVYVLPAGGSTPLGIWGYINFMRELNTQIDLKKFKGILSAAGSGGTSAGMLLGAAMLSLEMKIYGVNVVDDAETTREIIIELVETCIEEYNLKVKVNYNNLVILDGYSDEGYKTITDNKLKAIKRFFQQSGILLDPTYTGKAFYAYHQNFLRGKRKSNILFLHTGGIFGIFSKRRKYLGA
ncbi:MAG: pyridoxal-phosphate dependent enzyme [Bacteroidota bacterium]